MISRREQSCSTSAMSCVVSSTVTPRSRLICAQEVADAVLGHHVQPDGRLVQVEDLRIVQQRGRQVAAHALAERELAHGRAQERVEVEQVAEGRRRLRSKRAAGTR